jgi:hypothetical protein
MIYGKAAKLWTSHGYHVVPLIALNTSTRQTHSQHTRQMALIESVLLQMVIFAVPALLYCHYGHQTYCCIINSSVMFLASEWWKGKRVTYGV